MSDGDGQPTAKSALEVSTPASTRNSWPASIGWTRWHVSAVRVCDRHECIGVLVRYGKSRSGLGAEGRCRSEKEASDFQSLGEHENDNWNYAMMVVYACINYEQRLVE